MTDIEFFEKVARMRLLQWKFLRERSADVLVECKLYEQAVDREILRRNKGEKD